MEELQITDEATANIWRCIHLDSLTVTEHHEEDIEGERERE